VSWRQTCLKKITLEPTPSLAQYRDREHCDRDGLPRGQLILFSRYDGTIGPMAGIRYPSSAIVAR
jgi:hypothetical protein